MRAGRGPYNVRRVTPRRKRKKGPLTRPATPCVLCGRMGTRPRGLCWPCYAREAVRETVARKRPLGVTGGHGRLPAEPTQALPGSEEKVEVMCRRAERGEAIFHPLDARHPDGATKTCFDFIPEEDEVYDDDDE